MLDNSKICKKCKKEVNIELFQDKTKNKERVSKYNKYTNIKNKIGKKVDVVYGRKKGTEDWIKYKSQADVAEKLNLCKPNINKVIKGSLKTTGGYEFKIETENNNVILEKNWENIKKENNYSNGLNKSPNRIEHTEVDGIIGKICCTCKECKPLTKFNKSKSHWDNLRNDCKKCLTKYRIENKEKINKFMIKYEKIGKK